MNGTMGVKDSHKKNPTKPIRMWVLFTEFLVPGAGIEPAHLSVSDFESDASTNSTTRAILYGVDAMFETCA